MPERGREECWVPRGAGWTQVTGSPVRVTASLGRSRAEFLSSPSLGLSSFHVSAAPVSGGFSECLVSWQGEKVLSN